MSTWESRTPDEVMRILIKALEESERTGIDAVEALKAVADAESKNDSDRALFRILIEYFKIGQNAANPEKPEAVKIKRHEMPKNYVYPLDVVTTSTMGGDFEREKLVLIPAESQKDSAAGKEISIKAKVFCPPEVRKKLDDLPRILRPDDKEIMIAIAQLYKEGQKDESGKIRFTIRQLWHLVGDGSKLNPQTRERLLDSVRTLALTWIAIDNSQEAALYRYPLVIEEFSLLQARIKREIVSGSETDTITISEYPRLMEFAEGRKQITVLSRAALTAGTKTVQGIAMHDYLIRRIAKLPKGKGRILIDTVFRAMNATTKDKKRKTKERFFKTLDELQKAGLITRYERQPDAAYVEK